MERPENNKDEQLEQLQDEGEAMRIQMMGKMALIQNLAQGQEGLRAFLNKLHQDGCRSMKQTVKIVDQGINQPPVREEVGNRPFMITTTSQAQPEPLQRQQGNRHKKNTSERRFTEINMSLDQALQRLLKAKLVILRDSSQNPNIASPRYNPDSRCAYHSNSPGHDTNSCWALRNKIQDLIDEGALEFTQDGQVEFFFQSSKAHHLK